MNRTALSVIALAVGAVLIFGLFNVYKPQVTNTVHDVFDKIEIPEMGDTSNVPDQYGVTPRNWKATPKIKVVAPNEGDSAGGHAVNSPVYQYNRHWGTLGSDYEPRMASFDFNRLMELTNNSKYDNMQFTPQKDFDPYSRGYYTTKFDKANNTLDVLMSTGW